MTEKYNLKVGDFNGSLYLEEKVSVDPKLSSNTAFLPLLAFNPRTFLGLSGWRLHVLPRRRGFVVSRSRGSP